MAESIEEFFTDSKLTGTNLREAAASIHALLTGDAAASATAECLTEGFNAPGPVTASLSEVLEECIAGAAEQLSETHEGLVQLTLELRARQEEKSGGNLSDFDNGLVMTFGERWARYGDPDPSIIWRDQARLEWTNVNHFVALLYSAGVKRLSSFGELTLQRSLRRGGWRINWNGSGGASDSVIALQGHAPAAAYWVIISGQHLYDDCNVVRTNWTTWSADLAWIASQDELDEETRILCQEAQAVMDATRA